MIRYSEKELPIIILLARDELPGIGDVAVITACFVSFAVLPQRSSIWRTPRLPSAPPFGCVRRIAAYKMW